MVVFHSEEDLRADFGTLGEEIGRHGVSILVWYVMVTTVEKPAGRDLSKSRPREATKAPTVKNSVVSPEFSPERQLRKAQNQN